jgi:hypothetical protein
MIGLFFPGIDRHHQQPNTQAHTLGIVVAIDKRELFMRQQRERYIANLAHAKDRLSHERRLADHFRQPAAANNHELEDRFLVMRTLTRNGGVVREDDGFKPTHVLHGLAWSAEKAALEKKHFEWADQETAAWRVPRQELQNRIEQEHEEASMEETVTEAERVSVII